MLFFRNRGKSLSLTIIVTFVSLFVINPLHAALVETQDILVYSQEKHDREQLLKLLAKEEVQAQLQAMGVSPQHARERVMAMTHEEVLALHSRIEELPAGSGVVGAIVLVFLVLLLTDIMGYTDVFPFVKKSAR